MLKHNYNQLMDEANKFDLKDMAQWMIELKRELEEASGVKVSIGKLFDRLRQEIIPNKMEDMGIISANLEGIGRIGVTADMWTSIPINTKEAAYQWLKDNDFGDIIKPAVNGATFKALVKEQIKIGKVIFPDNLFKITPYMRASVTKR